MEKFFKTDENIFDDEVLELFLKLSYGTPKIKNDNCDYEDITCFDDDVMLEFFYFERIKK